VFALFAVDKRVPRITRYIQPNLLNNNDRARTRLDFFDRCVDDLPAARDKSFLEQLCRNPVEQGFCPGLANAILEDPHGWCDPGCCWRCSEAQNRL
jgi:hypothetical protein